MVEVKFNLVKRDFVWIGFIVILLGIGFGYAYTIDGSGDPAVMGHSPGEIEVHWNNIIGIPAGFGDGVDDVAAAAVPAAGVWVSGAFYPDGTIISCDNTGAIVGGFFDQYQSRVIAEAKVAGSAIQVRVVGYLNNPRQGVQRDYCDSGWQPSSAASCAGSSGTFGASASLTVSGILGTATDRSSGATASCSVNWN